MPPLQDSFLFLLLTFLVYSAHGDGVDETPSSAIAGGDSQSLPPRSSSSSSLSPPPPPLLVFGILSQPLREDEGVGYSDYNNPNDYNNTYIAASYVKWLEDGGARSIPIPYDASPSLVRDILSQVDGVLFPGGADSSLPPSAITIWQELHGDKHYGYNYPSTNNHGNNGSETTGDRIPLWGTCLGLEYIVKLASGHEDILESGYNSTNVSLPLLEIERSGLYRPEGVYEIVSEHSVTMNNHHLGITPSRFRSDPVLSRRFEITSTNIDGNGRAFVSTIEPAGSSSGSTRHQQQQQRRPPPPPPPVYGVQYHPEKNSHEYGLYPGTTIPYEAIDHSPEGLAFSLYEARFLVDLALENVRNQQQQRHASEANDSSGGYANKYNKPDLYPMIHTYPSRSGYKFEEHYVIPLASHWEEHLRKSNDGSNKESTTTNPATTTLLRGASKDR
mmetsp:Transcript_12013/g.25400  ORF Transcript_12013/g.25400 Transcript_12013/m.25400 type:complete len:445 (+) Transcript_12013:207-1541(+)